ncbi:hypothetical protein [Solemya velum gill symbiont]|uniref:Uncharacterized protein n=1 Tax=Solemya velum gill symbiont TaxID=2340 RepID=A0A0B0HA08_SOVGS|nr:hypothetical protein [Solemya velum gill symbiont]KHF24709.1 hypothetical protein JV46_02560 [Solemya velum gill symbiont]OOY34735.1 hypothetical protein BOV88_08190 [Solemya velum gill symbiont]OOY37627.1 hypothetical protein BOV89_06155 [Solemya velum gill symbiont]OOY39425.1 hypothetical protein BOV90_09395 [Solemya velum gill symbiont]OOY42777.1 hypothetical protein BOV91_05905 [Solemya velum gill symbiont]
MELTLDTEKYEQLQKAFIAEITQTVMVKLVEAGLEGDQLEDATASITFNVASIIDDTTRIDADGIEVRPYLTFREGDNELVHCGENSYTYDLMMGVMKKLFHAKEG